jgi:glutamate-1-semialdehyde 2,1-aminomutase
MTAGIVTLKAIRAAGFYDRLAEKTAVLCAGVKAQAEKFGFELQHHRSGSMFGLFFAAEPVCDYDSAKKADVGAFNAYFHAMLAQGIYLAPSQFEAAFMSAAHGDDDIAATIAASAAAFAKVSEYLKNK